MRSAGWAIWSQPESRLYQDSEINGRRWITAGGFAAAISHLYIARVAIMDAARKESRRERKGESSTGG